MPTAFISRSRRRIMATAMALSIGLGAAAATLPAASIAHANPANSAVAVNQTFTDSGGYQLSYHRFEGGDAGALFYFDGDDSRNFEWPEGEHVQELRKQAKAYGFDLFYFRHPGEGVSWWRGGHDPDRTAQAVREFVQIQHPKRIQLAGYSGGAEFLTRHVMLQGALIDDVPTGVLLTGGGSVFVRTPAAPTPNNATKTYFQWVVGDQDTFGDVMPFWSANDFSARALEAYAGIGYPNVDRTVVPGVNHIGYVFGPIVGSACEKLAAVPVAGDNAAQTAPKPAKAEQPKPAKAEAANEPQVEQGAAVPSTSDEAQPVAADGDQTNPVFAWFSRFFRNLGWLR